MIVATDNVKGFVIRPKQTDWGGLIKKKNSF